MKPQKVFALFFLTLLFAVDVQAQDFSNRVFSGTINNRYPIRMTLTRRGAAITGSYVYTKVGKQISLHGEMQDDGIVLLFEENDKGENTGVFKGAFENRRFFGTWSEPDGSRRMPFEVTSAASSSAGGEGRVILEEKKVTLRRGTKAKGDYKEAAISFPLVKSQGATAAKIQTAISLKAVFDQSLEELTAEFRESWWLSEIFYEVNYNKNFILDITFYMSGVGAYPDTTTKHLVLNLKTGDALRAADVFTTSSLKTIALMADRRMQAEIKRAIRESAKEGTDIKDMLEGKHFMEEDLDSFSVSDMGVTFLYDFAFPHALKAAEPESAYLFTFQQLKPHIRHDGLLAVF
ncbi:MAG: hypothetical protein AB1631_04920 [Acidobacteriota bacterium]